MLISYNWLKEYVDVPLAPEKLAELFTMSGLSVESLKGKAGDHLFELEITSNRPDWLSYIGVAREVAAITGKKLKIPSPVTRSVRSLPEGDKTQVNAQTKLSIKVEDKSLCPRYTARVIRDIRVGESPAWLKSRLEAMGLRPINNIVDITNFCLFETGEPMHAFDLDKIAGNSIVIRRARSGEKIVTIDGVERKLDPEALVIADAERPVAIAGVMGGIATEVGPSTKNILLEAAFFDPISTRRTSRKLGVSTESSYRFERRVDIENILYSSDRALGLILEEAARETSSVGEIYDTGKARAQKRAVRLRQDRLDSVLGVEVSPSTTKKILASLGLKAKGGAGEIKFEIPSFRYDLKEEIDLIEEVARIYGYNRIPVTIPNAVEQPTRRSSSMIVEKRVREILSGLGAEEVITYSLIGERTLSAASVLEKNTVRIRNPLTSEQGLMRPTMLPGMLSAVLWNVNRKSKDLKLFEIGNIYTMEESLPEAGPSERKVLSICVTGETEHNWNGPSRPCTFFDLKGMLEAVFSELGAPGAFQLKESGSNYFSTSIELGEESKGVMGEVDGAVLNNFDIKAKVYFLEIDFDAVAKRANLTRKVKALPRYPSVSRDISIVVDKGVSNAAIIYCIRSSSGTILKDIKLIDRYEGKQIPPGKAGLTYRLEYQDPAKTLEEREVSEVHSKVLRDLESALGARLR